MRRALNFGCAGVTLAATLDLAEGSTGLLIVSGGNEIRCGPHRSMAALAASIAAHGYPVFRFDRRGVGDSEGVNEGYRSSAPDIAAAMDAFRGQQRQLKHIVAFGNCDAATALVLHGLPVAARVLANPWLVEDASALPPPAAIRDRYARRLRDPKAWAALLTGRIDLRALGKGLGRIAEPKPANALADAFARSVAKYPTTILLAARDNTAIAFAEAWKSAVFDAVRDRVAVVSIESASHSFANEGDMAALSALLLRTLASPG